MPEKNARIDNMKEHIKTITFLKVELTKNDIKTYDKTQSSEHLLKNIKNIFELFNYTIKYLIVDKKNNLTGQVDEKNNDIKIPNSLDNLVVLISYFEDFDEFIVKKLYDIISLEFYTELYSIYQIKEELIPFIDTDDKTQINVSKLYEDYTILYENFIELFCYVFDVNSDMTDNYYH